MSNAKISIVVPVYKVEPYLHRCVNSILLQTYENLELILVDDGSPDNCGAICDEYAAKDHRVHVIHQENGGLSAARNAGIDWVLENSSSEWISFIDSDDWVHEKYLELLLDAAEQNDARISMCLLQHVSSAAGALQITEPVNYKMISSGEALLVNAEDPYVAAFAWGRLYKKELFRDIRFPIGKLWEDLFTTHKVLYCCDKIALVESAMYFYFINQSGIMRSAWKPQKLDVLEAYEKLILFLKQREEKTVLRRAVLSYCESICSNTHKMNRSDISSREKRRIRKMLQKKIIHTLIRYKNTVGINFSEHSHYYICAFPRIFKAYQFGKPVLQWPCKLFKKLKGRK